MNGQKPQDRLARVGAELREISNGESDPAIAESIERAIVAARKAATAIEVREEALMNAAYRNRSR